MEMVTLQNLLMLFELIEARYCFTRKKKEARYCFKYNWGFSKKIQPKHTKTENEISKSMKRIFKGQHFVNINENSL